MQRGDLIKLNFEGLKMLKLNIPRDRAPRKDKTNKIIGLLVMLTLRDMS